MTRVEYRAAGNYTEIKAVEETDTSSTNLGRMYIPTSKFERLKELMERTFPGEFTFIEKEPK
jgi:hypothetical protein